jgi:hypothetical protein
MLAAMHTRLGSEFAALLARGHIADDILTVARLIAARHDFYPTAYGYDRISSSSWPTGVRSWSRGPRPVAPDHWPRPWGLRSALVPTSLNLALE